MCSCIFVMWIQEFVMCRKDFVMFSEDSCDESQVSTTSIYNYKLPHERKESWSYGSAENELRFLPSLYPLFRYY